MPAPAAITTYSISEMLGVVQNLKRPINGIRKQFVKTVSQSEAQFISFDVDEKKRYVAPYVHHRVRGKNRSARAQKTTTFVPPYIKQRTPLDSSRAFTRAAGESFGGTLTAQERLDLALASTLQDHSDAVDLRLEMQAVSALLNGTLTVTGDDYPTTTLDFGRDASLALGANTLAGANLWSANGSLPMKNINALNKIAVKLSGSTTPDIVMDADAWDGFENNASVQKKLDMLKYDSGDLKNIDIQQEGLVLRGSINGYRIWSYAGFFMDDADGVEKDIFGGGYVIGVGAVDMVEHYGAIQDIDAIEELGTGLVAVPIFPKMWKEHDPSELVLLTQSAPLVAPRRANASWAMKVL